jgi:hypothetical protein
MIQNKTEILNLKTIKTQVPIGYLTIFFFFEVYHFYKITLFIIFTNHFKKFVASH